MSEDIKQGVIDSSVTPTEQTTVENNEDKSSSSSYSQPTQGSGVNTAVGKTYTEEEVNEILHKRTKEYSEKIRQYEETLKKYNTETKKQEPDSNSELSENDKMFIEYLKNKIMPHLKLSNISDEHIQFIEAIKAREEMANQKFLSSGETILKESVKEFGLDEKSFDIVKELVASQILNNEILKERFMMRDKDVFKDAFNEIKNAISPIVESSKKNALKDVVKTKQTATNVKQPLNSGIGAALTEKKKLSDSELLDMAFNKIKNG